MVEDGELLDRVQQRDIKRLGHLTYEEMLEELGLLSLEKREIGMWGMLSMLVKNWRGKMERAKLLPRGSKYKVEYLKFVLNKIHFHFFYHSAFLPFCLFCKSGSVCTYVVKFPLETWKLDWAIISTNPHSEQTGWKWVSTGLFSTDSITAAEDIRASLKTCLFFFENIAFFLFLFFIYLMIFWRKEEDKSLLHLLCRNWLHSFLFIHDLQFLDYLKVIQIAFLYLQVIKYSAK